MGIRFLCPNGHKLNVKAFLAGERGICPQCDAKFLVPSESGGQVEAIADAAADPVQEAPANPKPIGEVTASPPPTPPPAPEPTPPVANAPDAAPEVWYVRTATGEQFGPAQVDVMRQWVAEGRVTVDCFVWRTGWEDWKSGGQAITFLNVIPPPPSLPSVDSADPNPATVASSTTAPNEEQLPAEAPNSDSNELPEPTNPTTAYHTKRRLRQDRARKITLLLGVVVVVLFAVLVGVLINNK
ncbi:MAG: DUF4339 domain-containing protein [Planctomycetota bacterium]